MVNKKKSKVLGILIITSCLVFMIFYTWALFFSEWPFFTLQVSIYAIFVIFVGLIISIGKKLFTTSNIGKELNK